MPQYYQQFDEFADIAECSKVLSFKRKVVKKNSHILKKSITKQKRHQSPISIFSFFILLDLSSCRLCAGVSCVFAKLFRVARQIFCKKLRLHATHTNSEEGKMPMNARVTDSLHAQKSKGISYYGDKTIQTAMEKLYSLTLKNIKLLTLGT